MARRRCLHRGCGALIRAGSYCPRHKPYGQGWGATREAVLARDRYRCWKCGGRATTADHIVPTSHGGTDDPGNLRAACRACNTSKGGVYEVR